MKAMIKLEQNSKPSDYIKPEWYLVQTKPRSHFLASKHLEQQGFEIFLPLMKKTTKSEGKFTEQITPLFLNYLFLGIKSDKISWKSINATRGVSKIITLDGKFRAVETKIIEGLRSRCNPHGILNAEHEISSGDKVKIERGSFVDFVCKVESIADSQRVWVLMDIMQQKIRAQIPMENLSKVC